MLNILNRLVKFRLQKFIYSLIILSIIYNKSYSTTDFDKWILPQSSKRYNEITFLTSHNSFSNEEDGYIQPQQKWNLQNQLANGIRGFMLDTHYSSNLFSGKKKIRLCHRNCTLTQAILRPFKGKPMSFKKSLLIFKDFLKQNPKEIITFFLENYTQGHDLDASIESSGIQEYILTPKSYNPVQKNGWPVLSWMQKNNKRLVIFNQRGETKYAYDEWSCHFENQHGTLDINKAAKERLESLKSGNLKDRYIYVMNYFPHFYVKPIQSIDFKTINSTGVKDLLNKTLKTRSLLNRRYPNFIAVDFVNEGNLMRLVNRINNSANNLQKRKNMYRKLPRYKK